MNTEHVREEPDADGCICPQDFTRPDCPTCRPDSTVGQSETSAASVEAEIVAAIRLAFEGGADDRAKVTVTEKLLAYAPSSDPSAVGPVQRLLRAIRDADAELAVR